MNITVTVDDITLNTLVAKVIAYDEDGDPVPTGEEKTVGSLVAEQIVDRLIRDDRYPALRQQVLEIRQEEIRAAIRPAIEQAVAQPLRKTNRFGEATGEVTTLNELITDDVRAYLQEPADKYNRQAGTLLQKLIRDSVAAAFKQEIADAVKAAREAVTKEIGGQISDQVAAAVRKGLTA